MCTQVCMFCTYILSIAYIRVLVTLFLSEFLRHNKWPLYICQTNENGDKRVIKICLSTRR